MAIHRFDFQQVERIALSLHYEKKKKMLSLAIARDLARIVTLRERKFMTAKKVRLRVMGFQGKTDRNKPLKLRALVVP